MSGFLSKFNIRTQNNKTPLTARQKTTWVDEADPHVVYILRPRARRVSIKMDTAQRRIVVNVPGQAKRLKDAQNFVRQKWDWIQVQLETLPPAQPFEDGGKFLFRGELFTLSSPETKGRAHIDEDMHRIHVPAPDQTLEGRTRRFLIRTARADLEERTRIHAQVLGKTVDKISVRDTSSRWGSCVQGRTTLAGQTGGHISYSWRLICAPPFVLDYVCAHECAHLVHAHHGAEFWDLCHELVDTVKPAKRWLTQHGAQLHAVGANV